MIDVIHFFLFHSKHKQFISSQTFSSINIMLFLCIRLFGKFLHPYLSLSLSLFLSLSLNMSDCLSVCLSVCHALTLTLKTENEGYGQALRPASQASKSASQLSVPASQASGVVRQTDGETDGQMERWPDMYCNMTFSTFRAASLLSKGWSRRLLRSRATGQGER